MNEIAGTTGNLLAEILYLSAAVSEKHKTMTEMQISCLEAQQKRIDQLFDLTVDLIKQVKALEAQVHDKEGRGY